MAYTFDALINKVRDHVKDKTFDSSLILDYFDEIQMETLTDNFYNFTEDLLQETLSATQNSIDIDSDILVPLTISATNDATGEPTDLKPYYRENRTFFEEYPSPDTSDSGQPLWWTLFGGQIVFSRPADQSYTITMRYVVQPEPVTSSSAVPQIPETYKQIYIRAGRAGVEEYRGNYDIAALHRRKIEDYVERMKTTNSVRQFITVTKEKTSAIKHGRL